MCLAQSKNTLLAYFKMNRFMNIKRGVLSSSFALLNNGTESIM